uniref:C2H2-type domain-containing protein n=1 Tax=Hyaloperonospora arabidopsidis (strain Emoy2) TaxID=559515 RepID=M4B3P2_HYAAE
MLTCTACRLEFAAYAEQKEHFRMDWHRYNLKRKVVELPPVSEEQFELRMRKVLEEKEAQRVNDPKQKQRARKEQIQKTGVKVGLKCVACNKTFTNPNAHDNHLASKKHLVNVKQKPEITSMVETVAQQMNVVSHDDEAVGSHPKKWTEEELVNEMEAYKKQVPLEKEDCIFCTHHAASFDASLEHMLNEHGFFIPDVEFLVDPEGLIGYLAEKVKVGFYCLYCNGKGKAFCSHQDVQKHMTSLSHCKLRYEDEDLEELLEFYCFESQYASSRKSKTIAKEGVKWETDSEASIDSDEEVVDEQLEEEVDGDDDGYTMGVSETGELVLANGRRLGRREFRRYYKQRFRPDETRASVLAATKENLLLAYQSAGIDPRSGSTALSTAFVANFLKKRNNIAGGMSIVEAKRKNFWHEKNRSRLDNRSHKLQRNPNRRIMVTV